MLKRRGRPPHPDILTPRQWEVLGYLRDGLSDQQIAERMDVSLDGAKYHVSEILSKLGVDAREEAAAWTPAEPRRPIWLRGLALAAMLSALAIVAGVALLALGVANTSEAKQGEYVSRDAALLIAGSQYDDRGTLSTLTLEWVPADVAASVSPTEGAWSAVTVLHFDDAGQPECVRYTVNIPDEPRPRPSTTQAAVPGACQPWTNPDRDNQLYAIGIFLSWQSGSPAPKVSFAGEMEPAAAAQKAGLATPRPLPSGLAHPEPGIYPTVWLMQIRGELPTRTPQMTAQWDEHPTISCQDVYFGLQFWPVIDESKPAQDC